MNSPAETLLTAMTQIRNVCDAHIHTPDENTVQRIADIAYKALDEAVSDATITKLQAALEQAVRLKKSKKRKKAT